MLNTWSFVIETLDHTSSFTWIRFAGFPLTSITTPDLRTCVHAPIHVAASSSAAPAVTHILRMWGECFSLQQSQKSCAGQHRKPSIVLYYYTLLPIFPFSKDGGGLSNAPWSLILCYRMQAKLSCALSISRISQSSRNTTVCCIMESSVCIIIM